MPDSLKLLLIVSNSIKYNYIYYILGIIIIVILSIILNQNDKFYILSKIFA